MTPQMTLNEAYEELGLKPGSKPDEVKTAFKKMAAQWHPDKNKDPGAEDKFKRINLAKQTIDNPPPDPYSFNRPTSGFGGIRVEFNAGRRHAIKNYPAPIIDINLSFKESVVGAKKTVSYDRYVKCDMCDGTTTVEGNGICKTCNGQGGTVQQRGRVQVMAVCNDCQGSGKEEFPCDKCNKEGVLKTNVTTEIELPIPLEDGQIIKAANAGNYRGKIAASRGFFSSVQAVDAYGDVIMRIHVEKDSDMRLDETRKNIESDVNISLLDALRGTTIKVNTIKGEMALKVHPGTKNGLKMRMNGFGPGYIGSHIVNINVDYPMDTEKLVKLLEQSEEK
jgi:molecular chaperone DnaJ